VVNPEQARAIFSTAITTAITEKGPTVISLPGDVAASDAREPWYHRDKQGEEKNETTDLTFNLAKPEQET